MSEPVTRTWELRSPAPVERVWAALSDTDRFNKAAELGFHYDTAAPPEGSQRRRGWGRFLLGIRGDWEEEPFQHRAPEWFRIHRRFLGGPVRESLVTCRLKPEADGGTSVRYTVALTPAHLLGGLIAQAELAFNTGPKLQRGFDEVLGELVSGELPPALRPPPLDREALARVQSAELEPAAVREALLRLLQEAPLREQDRLHPLRLAAQWGQPAEVVVPALLQATRQGLLSLRWELLCPMCQGPAERPERLNITQSRVHCPSCNIHFDGSFPDSVAVVLRPAEAVRRFEVPVECGGSPGRTPHLVARETLPGGRLTELSLTLAAGAYRLRTWPPRETCALEILDGAYPTELDLKLGEQRLSPARATLRPGPVTLRVDHAPGRDVDLIVERLQRPEGVLTAGRLLSWPGARELLPERALDPSLKVEVERATVLALPPSTEDLSALLRQSGAAHLVVGDRGALGIFPRSRAAVELARRRGAGVLTVGPVLRVQPPEGRTVPMGVPVDQALALLPQAQERVLLPLLAEEDSELAEALQAAGLRTVAPPWDGSAGPEVLVAVAARG